MMMGTVIVMAAAVIIIAVAVVTIPVIVAWADTGGHEGASHHDKHQAKQKRIKARIHNYRMRG